MRRALGLEENAPSKTLKTTLSTSIPSGSQPQRRRFVRDGDVPVTIVRRDQPHTDVPGKNQLEAAREALRLEVAARERVERLLGEAQSTIRDLQTKLAHERLARDELLRKTEQAATENTTTERALQAATAQLAVECQARKDAEQRLKRISSALQAAEGQLQQVKAASKSQKVRIARTKPKAPKKVTRIHRKASAGLGRTKRASKPPAKLRNAAVLPAATAPARKARLATKRASKPRNSRKSGSRKSGRTRR